MFDIMLHVFKVMLLRLWHDVIYPSTQGEGIPQQYFIIISIYKGAGDTKNEQTHFIVPGFDVCIVNNIDGPNILALLKLFCHYCT